MEGISFIIATRWASEALELCLKSIIEGSAYKNQIIVVADRPSWQTLRLLQEDFSMIHGQDYYIVDFGHLDRSLDHGIQFAEKDYIAVACDDVVFCKEWDKKILETMDNHKDRVVSPTYFVGNTLGANYADWSFPKLKYSKNSENKDKVKNFDWTALNSTIVSEEYEAFCGASPVFVMHKDVYRRVNGLTYFSPHAQAHELDLIHRAAVLGIEHHIALKALMYHFGGFGNTDLQRTHLEISKGYFKCNVCGLLVESLGNEEHPKIDSSGIYSGATERGRIALQTGLFLCDNCKEKWYIDIEEFKIKKKES